VTVEIKFCGLTRPADAARAAELGAAFVGVIFAGGPRMLTAIRAAQVLADVPPTVRRVGVFAEQRAEDIARVAGDVALDVVQLHGRVDGERLGSIRRVFQGDIWPVVRIEDILPKTVPELLDAGDGLLLDAMVVGQLGGTGVSFPWEVIARELANLRGGKRIVLAGGLRPDNVGRAIASLSPDVVDVSSGVESAPGIKDHDRMRAFRDAVALASALT
jgi:phosphoribosylanthranilate isomerase